MQEPHQQAPQPPHGQQPLDDPRVRRLRHDMLDGVHQLNVCIWALPICTDDRERLQYLQEIADGVDRVIALLDEFDLATAGADAASTGALDEASR